MNLKSLVKTIRKDYGLDITEGDINCIATAVAGDQPYVELDDILEVVSQWAEDTQIAQKHGFDESILEWFPNSHGSALDEQLDDLEEDWLLD